MIFEFLFINISKFNQHLINDELRYQNNISYNNLLLLVLLKNRSIIWAMYSFRFIDIDITEVLSFISQIVVLLSILIIFVVDKESIGVNINNSIIKITIDSRHRLIIVMEIGFDSAAHLQQMQTLSGFSI